MGVTITVVVVILFVAIFACFLYFTTITQFFQEENEAVQSLPRIVWHNHSA